MRCRTTLYRSPARGPRRWRWRRRLRERWPPGSQSLRLCELDLRAGVPRPVAATMRFRSRSSGGVPVPRIYPGSMRMLGSSARSTRAATRCSRCPSARADHHAAQADHVVPARAPRDGQIGTARARSRRWRRCSRSSRCSRRTATPRRRGRSGCSLGLSRRNLCVHERVYARRAQRRRSGAPADDGDWVRQRAHGTAAGGASTAASADGDDDGDDAMATDGGADINSSYTRSSRRRGPTRRCSPACTRSRSSSASGGRRGGARTSSRVT